jgi:copper(I)-binding protein
MRLVHQHAGRRLALSISLCLLAGAAGLAAQPQVSASDGRARLEGDSVRVFVTITNPTMYDVYLVSATTKIARAVAFRDATTATARDLNEVAVPAFGTLEMRDRGIHMVVSGLAGSQKEGDTFTLVITTDTGLALETRVVIES